MVDDAAPSVLLSPDADPAYRARRDEIARVARDWRGSDSAPEILYVDDEQAVWRSVCRELYAKHSHLACSAYLEAWETVAPPTGRIPQLEDLRAALSPSGFRLVPVPGPLPRREFFSALGDGVLHASCHVRHASQPRFATEPDLIHAVLGHAVLLGCPALARLHRLTGETAQRLETDAALRTLARVFWFSCEFGVVRERDELVCCGAALLSSFGELDAFRTADVRPLDLRAMGTTAYDGAAYQPVLFAADSLDHLEHTVSAFLETMDDDTPARLAG